MTRPTTSRPSNKTSMLWLDDSHIDPKWIQEAIRLPDACYCQSCVAHDISNTLRRGKSTREGATLRLTLTLAAKREGEVEELEEEEVVDGTTATATTSTSIRTTTTMTMIVKQVATEAGRLLSQRLGLSREALFYKHLAPQIHQSMRQMDQTGGNPPVHKDEDTGDNDMGIILPKIYYSEGDFQNGSKLILMQDLAKKTTTTTKTTTTMTISSTSTSSIGSSNHGNNKNDFFIDSGVLFGPGNPNNWNRNVEQMAQEAGNPSPILVARATFEAMAKVHALYWRESNILLSSPLHGAPNNDNDGYSWLRGHDWIQGKNQDSWQASQQFLRTCWEAYLKREQEQQQEQQQQQQQDCHSSNSGISSKTTRNNLIQWDPTVRAAVEKAIAGISWQAQLERLNTNQHWTLVHGDFWPGNVMWKVHDSSLTQNNSDDENNNDGDNDEDKDMKKLKKKQKDDNDTTTSTLPCWGGSGGCNVRLVDWEMVGVGSGPQELGQYVISNMSRPLRQKCEESLVRHYYTTLTTTYQKLRHGEEHCSENIKNNNNNNNGNDAMTMTSMPFSMSWPECWKEYTVGGVERWLWFLVYFCGAGGRSSDNDDDDDANNARDSDGDSTSQRGEETMIQWAQFFHNQIADFMADHEITAQDITQPRP